MDFAKKDQQAATSGLVIKLHMLTTMMMAMMAMTLMTTIMKVMICFVLCYNRYVGRPPSASPAAGSFKQHLEEQAVFVKEALFFENADTATTTSASPSS